MKRLLLDGSVALEIRRRWPSALGKRGSVEVLAQEPNVVRQVHLDYLRAGADIISTHTYSTVEERLYQDSNLGHRFQDLMETAGRLAVEARDRAKPEAKVAACLPPLGDTYDPTDVQSCAKLAETYAKHVRLLTPYADLFLCETMSSAREARAAAKAAKVSGKPVYVAWTARDVPEPDGTVRLRSGETLGEAFEALADLEVDAVLLNCCWPESITAAGPEMASFGVPWGGYANGFSCIPDGWTLKDGLGVLGERHDLTPQAYTQHVQAWLDGGASIVGGCCSIGPLHITHLAQHMGKTLPPEAFAGAWQQPVPE